MTLISRWFNFFIIAWP